MKTWPLAFLNFNGANDSYFVVSRFYVIRAKYTMPILVAIIIYLLKASLYNKSIATISF